MTKKLSLFPALALFALAVGCRTPIEKTARDALAASQGFIAQAQQNHLAYCKANPQVPFPCVAIDQAVAAQNAAISALEIYCGFQVPLSTADTASIGKGQACNANPSARNVLLNALRNLSTVVTNYKQMSGGGP